MQRRSDQKNHAFLDNYGSDGHKRFFRGSKCAPDKNNKGKRELKRCKSTAFVSFPIKSSNGERRSPRSLRSNCDKNVLSKEIAVLGGEVLVRDGKEILRPKGARRCYLSGPEVFLAFTASSIFFASARKFLCKAQLLISIVGTTTRAESFAGG